MTPRGRFIFAPAAKAFMKRRNAGLQSTRQILSSAAPSESEATFRIHFPFVSNDLQKPTCDSPAFTGEGWGEGEPARIFSRAPSLSLPRKRPVNGGGSRPSSLLALSPLHLHMLCRSPRTEFIPAMAPRRA